ncbi:hypothetical protein PC118_g12023 [Phytophthora cactorum]|nr:hypothetical protein PC111_g11157 [Phytophthora cactorum]KAG2907149.1 hypothetical protein PC114_g10895 [Phytophthora cactorum]KAG2914556.1 hypothetical protein PC115_g11652 [Phytophthora cactorum]KAG2934609.1 hypothetical protein PC117_g12599 [Phytophthora cactorum]KAG2978905.1 hypothetical protein PC118_g12023 [Phytophthora cactorum]
MKLQTQSSVEIGYSVNFNGPDASGAVDGVTLMEKFDEDGHALLVWTSMMVESDGRPHFTSQGWISVKKLPSNPDVTRSTSQLLGQFMAKSRQERVQLKILEHAELQN